VLLLGDTNIHQRDIVLAKDGSPLISEEVYEQGLLACHFGMVYLAINMSRGWSC